MIVGTGIDLCSIPRMERAVRSRRFVERVFSPSEIEYAEKGRVHKTTRAARYASAFAAREAFAKASGVSIYRLALSSRFSLERGEDGAPSLYVPPEIDAAFESGAKRAWVSISHDGDYAAAVVTLEAIP
ncbi:MAG: holo-ACP synthase [Synergistaceae bacterium]|jgi:holo-[acyl-carrier protein] synthase|nr:holo-ACP synthase [Synergistaceae bacterium]